MFFKKIRDTNKLINEQVRKAVNEKHIKDEEDLRKILQEQQEKHIKEINKINNNYNEKLNKGHELYRKLVEKESNDRIQKYSKIIQERNNQIYMLKKQVLKARKKVRQYAEAYEIFRPYRDYVVNLVRNLKPCADKINFATAELSQYFGKLEDMASYHLSRMNKVETKIEKKLYVDDFDSNPEELEDNIKEQIIKIKDGVNKMILE